VGGKHGEGLDGKDGEGVTTSKDIGVPLMRGDDALYPILVNRGDITVKNITIESQKVGDPDRHECACRRLRLIIQRN
jgi:hypothetical protein